MEMKKWKRNVLIGASALMLGTGTAYAMGAFDQHIANIRANFDAAIVMVKTRDATISELQSELANKESELSELRESNSGNAERITELEGEIEGLNATIGQKDGVISMKERDIDYMKDQVAKLSAYTTQQIDELSDVGEVDPETEAETEGEVLE